MKNPILILILMILPLILFADFHFGKDLFNDGLYEEAVVEFEKVISEYPTSNEAQKSLFFIGECYIQKDQFDKAEIAYKRLWKGYPQNAEKDKTLYQLALTQFHQEKYDDTIKNLNFLIMNFPLSPYSEQSLDLLVQCYFELEDYNQVIIKGRKLIKDYEHNPNVPDIMLLMAKAYFIINIPEEGRRTLEKINTDYPSSNARWKALEVEIDLLEEEKGIEAAAEELAEKLRDDLPRQFEETLRLKLAKYYLDMENHYSARYELEQMIEKFNNSFQLDYLISLYTFSSLKLGFFQEIFDNFPTFKKVFSKSPLKAEYEYYFAKANYYLRNHEIALDTIKNILSYSDDDKIIFESNFLQANILENIGKLKEAISSFQDLINTKQADNEKLFLKIGNIYFDDFQNYIVAKKYYQQMVLTYSSPKYRNQGIYKIALCYEHLGEFNEALSELNQVIIDDIKDKKLKDKIIEKRGYLKNFKYKNYETAFTKLMNSFYTYLEDDNKTALKQDLVNILTEDLKEFEQSAELIDENQSPESAYKKAKIYLKIVEKLIAEDNERKARQYFDEVENLIIILTIYEKEEWICELNLEKRLLINPSLTANLLRDMETFVIDFPLSKAANGIILKIADYYLELDNFEKANDFYAQLQNDGTIDKEDFYNAKIRLAEYFYLQDEDDLALENYRLAEPQINVDRPEVYFHFSVVLNENDFQEEALEKLTFLINNAQNFAGYDAALKYFAGILRKSGDFQNAIKYQLLTPISERNDDFYKFLAEDYLALEDKEKAKETLMYILNKDEIILTKLANLQYETGDLEMAKYSFGELKKLDKENLRNYQILGHIAFIQEDFLEAAINYKKIVNTLADNFQDFENFPLIVKENIISLYRIENRPKAEKLTKDYKSILDEHAKDEIKLSEGIYYSNVDPKKANKIFRKLLKKEELNENTRRQTYFWRGILNLEQKEVEQAKLDFYEVTKSENINLRNQAYLKLGTINFSGENYQEALDNYFYVIQNDEKGKLAFDAARNFAFVCKTIEEWQKAVSAYEIILEKWGSQALESQTLFDIAFCHYRDKKYKNAIDMFRQALPLLENNETKAETQFWIGNSYFGLDDYDYAITEYLKLTYDFPDNIQWTALADLKVGESYVKQKKYQKAAQFFRKVISKYGKDSNWGQQASRRLEDLGISD